MAISDTRENSCEASNFYPLWLLAMAMSGAAFWRQWRQRCVEVMLLGAILVLTLYICFPFPAWLCRASLFSYVTGTRVLLPIGIAGILLTTMLMARTLPKIALSKRVLISAIAIAAIGLLLLALYPGNHEFFTPPPLWGLLVLNTVLVSLYCFGPTKLFCAAFIFCLGLNNIGVNPIARGLGPLLHATPSRAIRALVAQEPTAKWIVYSNANLAQFIKAQGADVLNGLRMCRT